MSQFKAIPQPADQRNVSQGDILSNFQYLSTPINVSAGTPPGIIPVDHQASGDNVANPADGFHNQVSFLNRTPPSDLKNAINRQTSDAITYTQNDGSGSAQIHMLNNLIDQPVTYLKLMCQFDATGALIGNNFNTFSVTLVSSGLFRIRFTTNVPTTNYLVFASGFSAGGANSFTFNYTNKMINRFDITIFNGNVLFNPTETSLIVLGLF